VTTPRDSCRPDTLPPAWQQPVLLWILLFLAGLVIRAKLLVTGQPGVGDIMNFVANAAVFPAGKKVVRCFSEKRIRRQDTKRKPPDDEPKKQGRRPCMDRRRLRKRPLDLRDILAWASAHREATGQWPGKDSGLITGTRFETWLGVDQALRDGLRGLPGGSSLARLLAEALGARNRKDLPRLSEEQILRWAEEHRQRTGEWPTLQSGSIPHSGGEKWHAIDQALRKGVRGFPGGSSLARLLARHRGVRNRKQLPPLTREQVLRWADAHHRRTGVWPTARSGPIADAPGETWLAADMALRHGQRGLPGGSSLALFLAERRRVRNPWTLPDLSVERILSWAEGFHARTGCWPRVESGPIPEAPGETWTAVNHALRRGSRGLPGDQSLAQLLAAERGVRNRADLPRLSRKQILAWADGHYRRTGQWPTQESGAIPEAPGETWRGVNAALRRGSRGLRGASSLPRLLAQQRRHRNRGDLPPLSQKKILAWADGHYRRSGRWPNVNSGPVAEAPGERWDLIDNALRAGHRGLAGGSSLLRLLARKRGVRNPLRLPTLTEEQILRWAERHREQTGSWPKYDSGVIAGAPGESWRSVDWALRYGKRGLAGESSLAKLLAQNRQA
jgi:hypothetical protein